MQRMPVMRSLAPDPPFALRRRVRAPGMRALRRLACVGLVLLVAACSVVGTLYERLDLLLGLEARSWLDLDAGQLHRFRHAVRERVEENRREELPHYVAFLERAALRVESPPDATTLLADAEELRLLLRGTVHRSIPLVADTLSTLHPAQVRHLEERFAERNAEYAEDYLDVPPERFRKNRLKRSRQSIERWTGRLDAGQRDRVAALVDAVPDGSAAWDTYSRAWQEALLSSLRGGADRDALRVLLERWWTTDDAMDPGYVAQLEDNRRIIAAAVAELLPTLSKRQRRHAAREFRELAADLRELQHPDGQGEGR